MKYLKPIIRRNRKKMVASLVAFNILLTSGVLLFPAERVYALGFSGPDSTSALGVSGEQILVSTAQELYELSRRVNSGESFQGKTIMLNEDLQLQELEIWEAIGTEENPFDGLFDGQEHVIRGFMSSDLEASTLFGNTQSATIRDTTLAVRSPGGLQEVNVYLFGTAIETTVQNCQVILDEYMAFTLFGASAFQPITSWYDDDPTAASFTITGVSELLGLAQLVNEGTESFSGKTISLSGNVNFEQASLLWKPIGTADNPFMGTFTSSGASGTIAGLNVEDVTVDSAGLFGHIENASISNIQVVDASVAASNNVGILVGHMTESKVENVYTTGKVSGVTSIGGVIGYATHTSTSVNVAYNSYSTADVVGTNMVGGFAGQINGSARISTCFATGNVSGVLEVGGFVGKTSNTNSRVSYVASTGNVKGSGKIGGIVGGGVSGTSADYSYTSSRVEAFSDSGAIMGAVGNTNNTYTSGQIYGPANDGYINAGVGFSGNSTVSLANWDAVGNTISRTAGISSGSTSPWFINASNSQLTILGSAFTSGLLEYGSGSGVERLPTGGYYPQLNVFNSLGGAFAAFSKVSTDAQLVRMPTNLVFLDGYLAESGASNALVLPDAGGRVSWRFENGTTSMKLADATIPGGENMITIENNKLKMTYPAITEYSVVLWGQVSGLDGLVLKKTVTVRDETARPILTTLPKALNEDTTSEFPDADRLSNMENSLFIEFSEPLTSAGSIPAAMNLIALNDSWSPTGTAYPVTYTLISDTILKLEWPADSLGYDQRFMLTIPDTLGITDKNGKAVNLSYYFMSSINMVAQLSFSPYVLNQISLNDDADEQVIRMTRDDANYSAPNGYLDGILSDNETAVTITDTHVRFTAVNTFYDTAGFPAEPGDTTLNSTNFYKYPGTYTLTYQVPDPEEPHRLSNAIVRTYEVTTEIKDWFYVDGSFGETHLDKYQPSLALDAADVGEALIHSTAETARNNIVEALQHKLGTLHKATSMGASGEDVRLKITYDFSKIGSSVYKDGFNGIILYGIDGATPSEPVYVQIEGALNPLEITTDYERYVVSPDSFEQKNLLSCFHPSLLLSGRSASEIPLTWQLVGEVDPSQHYTNQMVTIRANNIYGLPDLSLEKNVFVSIIPGALVQDIFKDRSSPEYDQDFWARIERYLRGAETGAVVDANLKQEYAYAPRSVFRALDLEGHENITLDMHMPNGISLAINSDSFGFEDLISPSDTFNVFIEEIENLDVNRDSRGAPVQQFYVQGLYDNVSNYTLRVPLREDLQSMRELNLYTYNAESRMYHLVSAFDQSDIEDGVLTVKINRIDGEYVLAEKMPTEKAIMIPGENHNPGTGA